MKTDNQYWRGKSVLVTGANGFFGGWLIRELVEREANVIALIRRERPESQFALANQANVVTVVTGSVADQTLIDDVMKMHSIDCVFHTAMAGGDVTATRNDPLSCFRSTVDSTMWLLDAIRERHPNATMVVSSSDKAYGKQKLPYNEQQALAPTHPQEVAKAAQDLFTQSFGKVYDLKVAVTRCANFFGPYDFNFSRIIPYVSRCAAEGTRPELRSNGLFVRDFLHIQEAATAHLNLAQQLSTDSTIRGEAFNFSYGEKLTVLDIVQNVLEIAKVDFQPLINDTAAHEIPNMWLSSEKARQMLGWKPAMSFDEGLESTVQWYLEHFKDQTKV